MLAESIPALATDLLCFNFEVYFALGFFASSFSKSFFGWRSPSMCPYCGQYYSSRMSFINFLTSIIYFSSIFIFAFSFSFAIMFKAYLNLWINVSCTCCISCLLSGGDTDDFDVSYPYKFARIISFSDLMIVVSSCSKICRLMAGPADLVATIPESGDTPGELAGSS